MLWRVTLSTLRLASSAPSFSSLVPFSFDDAKMVQYPTNPRDDRASGVNDQRHRFVTSYIWDCNNYAKGLPAWARSILGGWEFSGILTAQSGQPWTPLSQADSVGNSDVQVQRAIINPDAPNATTTRRDLPQRHPRGRVMTDEINSKKLRGDSGHTAA